MSFFKRIKKSTIKCTGFIFSSRINFVLAVEIFFGVLFSFISFVLFVKLGKNVLEREVLVYDNIIASLIFSLRSSLLTSIMFFISFLGSEILLFAGTFIAAVLSIRDHKKEAFFFLFILVTGLVINLLLKYFLKIPRPNLSPLYTETTYSFPSLHAMNSFVFYSTISYFIFHFTRNKKLSIVISSFSILLILLIGFSRIYLGVHHPSDVLAGYIAGFWWFVTVLLLERIVVFFKLFKESKR